MVRINDRGPFAPGRVIDLSRAAAEALEPGTAAKVPATAPIHVIDCLAAQSPKKQTAPGWTGRGGEPKPVGPRQRRPAM